MQKKSAGILLFRFRDTNLEVLLVHPGGPFWSKKDLGVWSIPKGEFTDEFPLEAAKREFFEETGKTLSGNFMGLNPIKLTSGKIVFSFALEEDFDEQKLVSNTFSMEWPPKSGKFSDFPEIDRAQWFDLKTAREKLNESQLPILEELEFKILK